MHCLRLGQANAHCGLGCACSGSELQAAGQRRGVELRQHDDFLAPVLLGDGQCHLDLDGHGAGVVGQHGHIQLQTFGLCGFAARELVHGFLELCGVRGQRADQRSLGCRAGLSERRGRQGQTGPGGCCAQHQTSAGGVLEHCFSQSNKQNIKTSLQNRHAPGQGRRARAASRRGRLAEGVVPLPKREGEAATAAQGGVVKSPKNP